MNYTLPKERIISLDILRGFAVLGILIMNIQNFSMITSAYINPNSFGDLTGLNKWVWIISHVLADTKFMSIFSILFGAGILLFLDRAKTNNRQAGKLHYWRNTLLLLFGLIHAYIIWSGDILVAYSLCAFFVYLFRNKNVKTLFILSGVFVVIPFLLNMMSGLSLPIWPEEDYNEQLKTWLPNHEIINAEIAAMNGSWMDAFQQRKETAIFMQTFLFFFSVFWRVTAMMLLGMGLYKLGILSAQKSDAFYKKMAAIGLLSGYGLIILGVYQNFAYEWKMDYSFFFGNQFNYWGSIGVALGYIAIIMLISNSNGCTRFKNNLARVGKMAFSNYILMSVIGSLLFSGIGFGLFGIVERWHQAVMIIGIWIILILFSNLWLKTYKLGPLEWFWRKLTYFKR